MNPMQGFFFKNCDIKNLVFPPPNLVEFALGKKFQKFPNSFFPKQPSFFFKHFFSGKDVGENNKRYSTPLVIH
jgi:hypothetical protein